MHAYATLTDAVHHHIAAGNFEAAGELYRQVLATDPQHAAALAGIGALEGRAGHPETAQCYLEQACALAPDNPLYLHNFGESLRQLGQLARAEEIFRKVIALDAGFGPAYESLISIVDIAHADAQSRRDGSRSAQLAMELAILLNNYGNALLAICMVPDALVPYRRAIAVQPGYANGWSNLGNALRLVGLVCEAEAACRTAITLDPACAAGWNNLGNAVSEQGRFEESPACYDKALALRPDFPEVLHNRGSGELMNLLYLPQLDATEIFERHRAWGAAFPAPETARALSGRRPLRIGYLSADFRQHAMAHFLEPLLAHHDKNCVELTCYAQGPVMDAHTQKLMAYGHQWRWIHELDDAALAARIEQDGIDILVDCLGHTNGTRLAALACKPAPIMMSWLGYLGTTGLPAMDYRLTDAWVDPPGLTDAQHTETLLAIPGGMMAYQPHQGAPDVSTLPMLKNGVTTFGSLNNIQKINPVVVSLWARVLHAVPDSRLLLQSIQLADAGMVGRLRGMFEVFGIAPSRLDLRPASADFLNTYAEIDIALDTTPYGGGATTCDALWMGVPVITLAGRRPAGRLSTSILHQIGRSDWIAGSDGAYVGIASALASSPILLGEIRAGLRTQMQASSLCDGKGFVRRLEQMYVDAAVRQSLAELYRSSALVPAGMPCS